MPPTTRSAPRLSDAELSRVLELVKNADSVELKLTVPSVAHRATIQGLPIDPVEAQPRQVFFFDTPNLDLDKAGLVVRARRIQGGRGDSVVKLRPVVPNELPDEVRRSASFNVEVDAMPGGYVCSGSMKGRADSAQISDAVHGTLPIRKIFTKEQRAFFTANAPAGIELDALVPLGPTYVLKLVWVPKDLGRKFVAELWLYQDGSRILELSTKCLPSETFQVAAEARAYLSNLGVKFSGSQQTKTRTALEFFRTELAAAATPRRGPGRPRGSTTRGRTTGATRSTRSTRSAAGTAAASTAASSMAAKPATAAATKTTRKSSTGTPSTAKAAAPKAPTAKAAGTTRRPRKPTA